MSATIAKTKVWSLRTPHHTRKEYSMYEIIYKVAHEASQHMCVAQSALVRYRWHDKSLRHVLDMADIRIRRVKADIRIGRVMIGSHADFRKRIERLSDSIRDMEYIIDRYRRFPYPDMSWIAYHARQVLPYLLLLRTLYERLL